MYGHKHDPTPHDPPVPADGHFLPDSLPPQFDVLHFLADFVSPVLAAAPTCHGQEDVDGRPACGGDDVRPVHAMAPFTGDWFRTQWCSDCRALARVQGYVVIDVVGDCADAATATAPDYLGRWHVALARTPGGF